MHMICRVVIPIMVFVINSCYGWGNSKQEGWEAQEDFRIKQVFRSYRHRVNCSCFFQSQILQLIRCLCRGMIGLHKADVVSLAATLKGYDLHPPPFCTVAAEGITIFTGPVQLVIFVLLYIPSNSSFSIFPPLP